MTTSYEAPHITEARENKERALKHRCPFCHSEPGHQCRTLRGRGPEIDTVHSRRIALALPEDRRVRVPAQVKALCCQCGNLRTVSEDYSRYQDPNNAHSPQGRKEGWRKTESLKCDECGQRTRHAILHADGRFRDWDEVRQRIALGDPDTSQYPMGEENIKQLRREYRQLFPRNPNLRHRFRIADAQKVWDEGGRDVIALCGEPDTIETDPKTWGTSKADKNRERNGGYLVAEQLSDIEYTDLETGLEWIDMDCVDCCRVANRVRMDAKRDRLKWFFTYFALKMESIPDLDVGELEEHLDKLWIQTKEPDNE